MMKKNLILSFVGTLSLLLCLLLVRTPIVQGASDAFEVDEVLKAIKREVVAAQATDTGKPRLRIDRVELELAVVSEKGAKGGIKIKVANLGVGAGGGVSKSETNTLKLRLIPSAGPIEIMTTSELGLVTAINSVKEALRNAINEPPPLKLETFVFEAEIAIQKSLDGKLSFLFIDLLGAEAKNLSKHKIKIFLSLAVEK
jgi:hypothetical protein